MAARIYNPIINIADIGLLIPYIGSAAHNQNIYNKNAAYIPLSIETKGKEPILYLDKGFMLKSCGLLKGKSIQAIVEPK